MSNVGAAEENCIRWDVILSINDRVLFVCAGFDAIARASLERTINNSTTRALQQRCTNEDKLLTQKHLLYNTERTKSKHFALKTAYILRTKVHFRAKHCWNTNHTGNSVPCPPACRPNSLSPAPSQTRTKTLSLDDGGVGGGGDAAGKVRRQREKLIRQRERDYWDALSGVIGEDTWQVMVIADPSVRRRDCVDPFATTVPPVAAFVGVKLLEISIGSVLR